MNDKSKGKRRNYSKKRTKKEVDTHDKSASTNETINTNDPLWYIRDQVMKQGLTSMPTFEFRGIDSPLESMVHKDTTGSKCSPEVSVKSPTVAAYRVNPSPGGSYYGTDPINMAARMLYSKLSSSNAKTSNYAPQDVATLMLAIGEVISLVTHYTRLYGITQYYNKINRAIPNTLLLANGVPENQIQTWVQKLPEFRAELNQLITIANSITFPGNIAYFRKCSYLYQHVYIDNYSAMTGYHILVPKSVWKVNETTYEGGTILESYSLIPDSSTLPSLNLLRSMINELLTSATYNYIYSDIINLATRGVLGADLLSFGTIPIDHVVEPILNDQFNWQIMNATIFGEPNAEDFSGVLQNQQTPMNDVYPSANANALIYAPHWKSSTISAWWRKVNPLEPIVRVPDVNISDDDLLDLIAFTGCNYIKLNADAKATVSVDASLYPLSTSKASIPDHYVSTVDIFYGEPNNTQKVTIEHNCLDDSTNQDAYTLTTALVSEFEHFPLVYSFLGNNQVSEYYQPTKLRIFGRLGAYTLDMAKAIKNIRRASYLGLFTID